MPLASALLCALPINCRGFFGRIAGSILFRTDRSKRRVIASNLLNLFGARTATPAFIGRTARKTFNHLARATVDMLLIPKLNQQRLEVMAETRGRNYLDQALSRGRGVIFVTAHLGGWELGTAYYASLGYPVVTIFEPLPAGVIETLIRYRTRAGMEIILMNEPLKILRALKNKKVLAIAGDRDLTGTGIELPFGHGRRCVPRGPATLALRTDAPILVGCLVANPGATGRPYLGIIEPPIDFTPTGDQAADVLKLTEQITARLCRLIQTYPDQWFVFQEEWRHR